MTAGRPPGPAPRSAARRDRGRRRRRRRSGPIVVRALAGRRARAVAAPTATPTCSPRVGDSAARRSRRRRPARRRGAPRLGTLAATSGAVDGLLHLVGGWRGGRRCDEAPTRATTSCCTTCSSARVQHATRAFAGALARERPRALRARLLDPGRSRPTAGNAAYAATKAAAEAWTLALADELAETGATANVVVVNAIVTPEMREREPRQGLPDLHRRRRRSPTRSSTSAPTRARQDERPAAGPASASAERDRGRCAASPPTTTPGPIPRCSRRSRAANDGHAGSYGDDPLDGARRRAVPGATSGPTRGRGSRLQRDRRQRARARRADAAAGGASSAPSTSHLHVDECGAPERLGRRQAARRVADARRQAVARAGRGAPGPASATSTRCSPGSSRSPRPPSSARSTRSRSCARSPTWPTRTGCCCTSTAPGWPTPPPRSASGLRRSRPTSASTCCRFGGDEERRCSAAEAVVFLRPGLGEGFAYLRKQDDAARLEDALLSAQFEALLGTATSGGARPSTPTRWPRAWPRASADRRACALTQPVQANARLRRPPPGRHRAPAAATTASTSGTRRTGEVRWMCSWDTRPRTSTPSPPTCAPVLTAQRS